MRNQRKFSNILINKDFQLKYVFWISGSGVLLAILYSVIFYIFIKENYAILVDLSPMTDEAKNLLYQELNQIIIYLSCTSLLFLSIVTFVGLLFSHRVAGPLRKFETTYKRIEDGDLTHRMYLREKDEFKDVAKKFNRMMDAIEEKVK